MGEKSTAAMSQFLGTGALLRLLRRGKVERGYRGYVAGRLLFSVLIAPLRWWERLRWGATLRRTQLTETPIFLLGMGRSGTTHLHYLLAQDPQFGVVTNYQAAMHPIALAGRGWLDTFLSSRIPSKRPMDNVALTLESPQEEELALATITEHAAFHFASFPQELPGIYDRYVTGLGQVPSELEHWKGAYMEVLKKATVLSGMRRLLLKTPANTGRVRLLTQMFPGARYVYIVRNPYKVFQSMRNMYRQILPGQTFQSFEWEAIDKWILHAYTAMISSYLQQRENIPEGDLIEIKYEDLDEAPMETAHDIYRQLGLANFEQAKPNLQAYLDGLESYQKNSFDFPDEVIDIVNEHWAFAFEAFGYEKLTTTTATSIPA